MKACPDYDPLLPLRAAGALAPDDATRVEAHLAACAGCRAEADADAAVLELVRLPAASPDEREALRELPARTVGAYRALERSRGRSRRALAVTFAAAAAVLLAVVTPGVLTGGPGSTSTSTSTATTTPTPTPTPTPTATATEPASWASPDLDALWDETDVLAVEAGSVSGAETDPSTDDDELALTEAALGAWDDAGF